MTKYNNLRFERVMDALAEYIDKEGLGPGDAVPSERELAGMWQVSRGTVREAVGRMCREGLLISEQGKGTYVAREKEHIEMKTMISFSGAFSGQGRALTGRVIYQTLKEADSYLAKLLDISSGDMVHVLARVREIDKRKLLLEISHIPSERCPGLEKHSFENTSLYSILEIHYGIYMERQDISVQLSAAREEEAKLLDIEPGGPVFVEKARAYDREGKITEYTKTIMDARKGNYTISIKAAGLE